MPNPEEELRLLEEKVIQSVLDSYKIFGLLFSNLTS